MYVWLPCRNLNREKLHLIPTHSYFRTRSNKFYKIVRIWIEPFHRNFIGIQEAPSFFQKSTQKNFCRIIFLPRFLQKSFTKDDFHIAVHILHPIQFLYSVHIPISLFFFLFSAPQFLFTKYPMFFLRHFIWKAQCFP